MAGPAIPLEPDRVPPRSIPSIDLARAPTAPRADTGADRQSPAPVPTEILSRVQVAIVAVYIVAAVYYLAWRPATFNPQSPVFSWLLYGAELFGFATALLHIHMVWRLTVREAPPPPDTGLVDVFVTTYDEPVDVVRRTLIAATRMRYPHATWLLDDGNREEMRALAAELNVRYLARTERTHAKAGNLNHALRHARGDFVAVFDADHAPARGFLERTLGYFRDPAVAFVSTPQDFYNLDSFQHRARAGGQVVWNEQSLFFRVIQRGKDAANAAFFCGTCGVLRRRALDDIGGFATDTLTEDLDTSIRLHRRGWRSVYHAESLAFGIAPADIVPFVRQRMRWGQGAMQVFRRHRGILFASGLTLRQRLHYLASILMYLDGWQKLVFYLAPVIVLLTGAMPVAEVSWPFLARFVPYYLLTFWVFEEVSRGYGRALDTERYNMARYAAFMWAATGLVRDRLRFLVTSKRRDRRNRHAARRFMLPQTLVFVGNFVAIPGGIALFLLQWTDLPAPALVANVIWALVNASLARAVIGFTQRIAGFHRREYRFPIPLPALLDATDARPRAGVLDDVSGDGFRYYGLFPPYVRTGDLITGEIVLPDSRLPFRARIRAIFGSDRDGEPRALGCEFEWAQPRDAHELLAFLYGSDLQWKLNRFAERSRTPFERLVRWMRRRSGDPEYARERWAAALVRSPRTFKETHMGMLAVRAEAGAPRTLIAFRRVGVREELDVVVTTRAGSQVLHGTAQLFDAVVASGTPLYFYRFTPEEPA